MSVDSRAWAQGTLFRFRDTTLFVTIALYTASDTNPHESRSLLQGQPCHTYLVQTHALCSERCAGSGGGSVARMGMAIPGTLAIAASRASPRGGAWGEYPNKALLSLLATYARHAREPESPLATRPPAPKPSSVRPNKATAIEQHVTSIPYRRYQLWVGLAVAGEQDQDG